MRFPQLPSFTFFAEIKFTVGTSPFEQYTFNTYVVKNSGVLEPFTLPAGKVLVVTQFDWTASGSSAVANQARTAYLFPATTSGSSAPRQQCLGVVADEREARIVRGET